MNERDIQKLTEFLTQISRIRPPLCDDPRAINVVLAVFDKLDEAFKTLNAAIETVCGTGNNGGKNDL